MADEIKSGQVSAHEQANAPKESTQQQAAQQIIGEGSAKAGAYNPVPMAHTAQKAADIQPMQTATTSTQVSGGTTTVADATPTPNAPRDQTPLEKRDTQTAENKAQTAQAEGVEMLSVTVDGVEIQVPKGTLAIEAAFRAGADLPYFCYHPRLTSVGACRMCLANIELEMFGQKRTSLLTCCTVPVANGMGINTKAPEVKKAQSGMLEFLLANHPLDCPICDRGGECPLQNMTIAYGPPTSRFIEVKRHYPKAKPISDFVVLDRERCIQCMRCTRFCEEISGDSSLTIINRGSSAEIGTFFDHDFVSNFSGNTIEICPVGALTSRSYRFAGRPWEIKSTDSICGACGNGCNIAVQTRLNELVRINGRTNESINEEWTCDRGKFGQYYVNDEKRLSTPLIRKDGELVPASWDEALAVVAERMVTTKELYGADSIAAMGSTVCTVEENYLLGKLMQGVIGTSHIAHKMHDYPLIPMQTSIAAIENFATIVSVGLDLRWDQPMLFLRAHKAQSRKNATVVAAETIDDAVTTALQNGGENVVLLLSHKLDAGMYEKAQALCQSTGAKMNILLPDCNSWGAAQVGAFWESKMPGGKMTNTTEILDGVANGAVKMLYILGSDPVSQFVDTEKATAALDSCPFTVVQTLFLTESANRADVVLPAASFAERDGTFVNIEGREQKIKAAMPVRGDARPDWRILADLLARLGTVAPYFSARDIYREYSRAVGKPVVPTARIEAASIQ